MGTVLLNEVLANDVREFIILLLNNFIVLCLETNELKSFTGIITEQELVGLMFYQNKSEYKSRCLNFNRKDSIARIHLSKNVNSGEKNLSQINVVIVIEFHNTDLVG